MNGAQALIRTLVDGGVDVCFTNPGTSEMHFVAALDDVPEMRGILGLFEGVVTGAADGYARMAGRPAATLLHLGPGLGNGIANLHNARRAATPMVNVVGDHATYHKQFDAPLESDIEALARNVSGWIGWPKTPDEVGQAAADAVAAAMGPPGAVATLVLPADASWSEGASPGTHPERTGAEAVPASRVADVAKVLRSDEPAVILIGGRAALEPGLVAASRVATATGAKVLCETFPARMARGAGVPAVDRLGYLAEFIEMQLAGIQHLVVVDTRPPVSFFAYPDKASDLVPDGCQVHVLADGRDDPVGALEALAEAVGADPGAAPRAELTIPERPTGDLDAETMASAIAAVLPEGAIVSDEGNTSGLWTSLATATAAPHDWLCLTGGAIGQGLPVATGAAVACPDRPVVCLEADGSAMYTLQSLWTQAREGLDVTTVILNNRAYDILNLELARVGAEDPGPKALSMLDLSGPDLDFVALARGMGVPATRPGSAEEFTDQFEAAVREPGPSLIEVVLPSRF